MIFKAEIQTWNKGFKALTEEQWQDIRRSIPSLEKYDKKPESSFEFLIDYDGCEVLAKYSMEVKLCPAEAALRTMIVKMSDRIKDKYAPIINEAEYIVKGESVQIAIPDLGLMTIRKTRHLEDCCTEHLQEHLDRGWRILAVCPPNSQRRPDYILGRSDNGRAE